MPLDAASIAFGYLVLGERGQEAGRRPAFLVRARGHLGPVVLDRGKAQIVEDEGQTLRVDRLGDAGHAATPFSRISYVLSGTSVIDDLRECCRIRREAPAQCHHVRQPTGIEIGSQDIGNSASQARSCARASSSTIDATSGTVGQLLQEPVEHPPIRLAREQLLAVDDADQQPSAMRRSEWIT